QKQVKDMRKILKLHTYISLFMKLSVLTCCVLVSTAGTLLAHRSDAQEAAKAPIHLAADQLSLNEVLEAVQQQSDVNLIYSPTQLDGDIRIEVPARETSLERLLQYLTANMPIVYEMNGKNLYINRKQQPGRVVGAVVDP